MRFQVKRIEIKLYRAKEFKRFGWWDDRKALKTRIKRHILGKILAQKSKMKKKSFLRP